MTVRAPLLSKYELHPADRLIHHRGKRREKRRRRDMEGLREMSKRWRDGGREEEERWEEEEARWKKR